VILILRNCIAVWSAFDLTDKGNNAGALSLSLNHRTDYDHWLTSVRSEGLAIAKAMVTNRQSEYIHLVVLSVSDWLPVCRQIVLRQTTRSIVFCLSVIVSVYSL
jgi:hypothetical protein